MHCTPFSFSCLSQQQHASLFPSSSLPTERHPAPNPLQVAWPGHSTDYVHKYMCVYVCASKPVPNESFTGSSTSGHSSTLNWEYVFVCVKCMTMYLCTERQKYTSIDFVSSCCLSCLKRMTIRY